MNKNIFKTIKSNSILYKMEIIFNELEELQKLKKLRDFKPFYELYNNTFDNKVKWFDFIKKENRIKNIINLSVKLGEYTKEQGNLIYQIFKNEELVKRDKKETSKLKRLKNKYYFTAYKKYIEPGIKYKDYNKKKGKEERIKELSEKIDKFDNISKKYNGLGLGLSICKNLVNLMNGSIDVTSEYNKGTKFKVSIPLVVYTESKINYQKEKKYFKNKKMF